MATMQKIKSNLWFDKNAEEAVNFYISIFKHSKIINKSYYGKEGFEIHGMPEGTVLTTEFELEGQRFVALNGGPAFRFNEAISFIIECTSEEELDYYWEKLTSGGDKNAQQCGWLKDKFGVSWQVEPEELAKMLNDPDKEKTERVMKALLEMKKLDIKKLRAAFEGK